MPRRVRKATFLRPSSRVRWYRARTYSTVPGCGNFGAVPKPPFTGSNCPRRPSMDPFGIAEGLRLVRTVMFRHGEEDAAEARAVVSVLRREVRAPVEHLAVRRQ